VQKLNRHRFHALSACDQINLTSIICSSYLERVSESGYDSILLSVVQIESSSSLVWDTMSCEPVFNLVPLFWDSTGRGNSSCEGGGKVYF